MNHYRVDIIKKNGRRTIHEATFLYKTISAIESDLVDGLSGKMIKGRRIEIWYIDTLTLFGKFNCSGFKWEIKLRNFINDVAIKNL